MAMYDIPTEGCNLEIMGYPFFAEDVSPNEAFRRREYNFNNIVGGTMKVVPGAYVGLDFSVTTHVKIDPDRPDEHHAIFQEMMSKPVEVVSPDMGGSFNAIVVVKPERPKLDYLKVTFSIKEIPDSQSRIPGEEFTVPATREVETKKGKDKDKKDKDKDSKSTSKSNSKTSSTSGTKNVSGNVYKIVNDVLNKGSKKKKETKKNKGKKKGK